MPPYKGSTLRGAFGYAFKKAVCITRQQPDCKACILAANCAYSYIFETPRPADSRIMRGYEKVPHPFVLRPPLDDNRLIKEGDEIDFGLVLIGQAREYLPYFILVMQELAARGLGRDRGRCRLTAVSDHGGNRLYSPDDPELKPAAALTGRELLAAAGEIPDELTINFLTPLRLVRERQIVSEVSFQDLFRALLRRLGLLQEFHCGLNEEIDYRGLIAAAAAIATVKDETRWQQSRRYSTRQRTTMSTGGLLGPVTFAGDFAHFWPMLQLGTWVNLGKNTSFGLGRYEILKR